MKIMRRSWTGTSEKNIRSVSDLESSKEKCASVGQFEWVKLKLDDQVLKWTVPKP